MTPEQMRDMAARTRGSDRSFDEHDATELESMADAAEREAEYLAHKAKEAAAPHSSESQARAQRDSIVAMVANLDPVECERCGKWHRDIGFQVEQEGECFRVLEDHEIHDTEDKAIEAAQETIQEDALSAEVRSDWHSLGDKENDVPGEYKITLCAGGPAVRLVGDLENGQPSSARLEHQDWGTLWTELRDTSENDDAALLAYAQQFYFGEG